MGWYLLGEDGKICYGVAPIGREGQEGKESLSCGRVSEAITVAKCFWNK